MNEHSDHEITKPAVTSSCDATTDAPADSVGQEVPHSPTSDVGSIPEWEAALDDLLYLVDAECMPNSILHGRLATLRSIIEGLEAERDDAIAHDRQPYPTAWAYEQACKALAHERKVSEWLAQRVASERQEPMGAAFWLTAAREAVDGER